MERTRVQEVVCGRQAKTRITERRKNNNKALERLKKTNKGKEYCVPV
jgi:hypothetical protein